jgi:uncharacterized Zn finger protein (UPF0148 family)
MPSRKASKKVKKWVPKKGWVIKKVKNPVVLIGGPSYPAMACPKCGFYPCYANAYGSYHCPRCGHTWQASTTTMKMQAASTHPARTCPYKDCGYYPCYWDATAGSYHCPHCGRNFP